MCDFILHVHVYTMDCMLKMMDFMLNVMNFVLKVMELCTKFDELCTNSFDELQLALQRGTAAIEHGLDQPRLLLLRQRCDQLRSQLSLCMRDCAFAAVPFGHRRKVQVGFVQLHHGFRRRADAVLL